MKAVQKQSHPFPNNLFLDDDMAISWGVGVCKGIPDDTPAFNPFRDFLHRLTSY